MIEVIQYNNALKKEWDNFVNQTKNGIFLFQRDFMEYHKSRFNDNSLMLYEKGKLKALFPGNKVDYTFHSHQGLTFGGILIKPDLYSNKFIEYFNAFNIFLKQNNFTDVYIRSIPEIYKSYPGGEEEYCLHHSGAKITACSLSSCIPLNSQLSVSRNRKRNLVKSLEHNITSKPSEKWKKFWDIMTKNMHEKYESSPVHSLNEINQLRKYFPDNILLFESTADNELLAGAIIFKYNNVIKVQYAHASAKGKESGAIDNLYTYLINYFKNDYKYIDFGTSNGVSDKQINNSLLQQKEGFGARAVVYNLFHYNLK